MKDNSVRPHRRTALRAKGVGPDGREGRSALSPAISMRLPRDGLRISLALLILVSIGRAHDLIGFSAVSPALILGGLTVAFAVLKPSQLNEAALLRTWPARVMAGLALTACISVPFGLSIGSSASFILSVYAKVLLLAFLIVAATRNARDLNAFVWAYVLSCALLAGFGLFGGGGMGRYRSVGMYDANDLSLILLTGIPPALAMFRSSRGRVAKVISLLAVIGGAAVIAGGSSRGGFFGLVAVGCALLFLLRDVAISKRVGFLALLALTLVLTAPQGYWERMQSTVTSPTEDYNWNEPYGRRRIWMRGLGYMADRPITGLGINNFARAEGRYSDFARSVDTSAIGVRTKWSAPHNSFLQVGAETGIPGLLLFSVLVFGGMIGTHRLHRRLPASWARGDPEARFLFYLTGYLPASFVGFSVSGFFLSYAYLDPVYVLGAFVAGIYGAVRSRRRREEAVSGPTLDSVSGDSTGRPRRPSTSRRSGA